MVVKFTTVLLGAPHMLLACLKQAAIQRRCIGKKAGEVLGQFGFTEEAAS